MIIIIIIIIIIIKEQRIQHHRQNRMFEYDQKKLYKERDGDSSGPDTNCLPDAEESAIFGATSGITQLSITEVPSADRC